MAKAKKLIQAVSIVNPDGTPTDTFMRFIQDNGGLTDSTTTDVVALQNTEIVAGDGLDGGGLLSAGTVTLTASVQEILDQLSTTQGTILYRGASDWAGLAPGTSGQVLQTNGAAANPSWVTPSGGSGLGPAWTTLTFGSTSSAYGHTIYSANESFTLAAGQKLEIEGYIQRAIDGSSTIGAGTGTNAVYVEMQGDNNLVVYRYSGGASTALSASGASTPLDYTGSNKMALVVNVHSSGSSRLYAQYEEYRLPTSSLLDMTTFSLVGSLTPWITTSNVSLCYVRARVVG